MHIALGHAHRATPPAGPLRAALIACAATTKELKRYSHDGWDLAFRFKEAAPGFEDAPPLLLVHPVGIGLSSWFWDAFADEWEGAAVFAPDLIGCGASEEWDPDARGLFVPLDWARGCESLWRAHIRRPCVVVAQGGLAPVGVSLAVREADTWRGGLARGGKYGSWISS